MADSDCWSKKEKKKWDGPEKAWFELEEYKKSRTCTCPCGHVFESQARELSCTVTRIVKDKSGIPKLDKKGNEQTEHIPVRRLLAKHGCSKCWSHWLKDFT